MPTSEIERHRRAKEIFLEVVDVPGDERERLLAQACADDETLRAEVRSLLALDEGETAWDASGPRAAGRDTAVEIGDRVEGERSYEVRELLGSGGMGSVYRAERLGGDFRQQVALKVLRSGFGSRESVERFHRERRLLARLEHPGIARMIDGGQLPDGSPFLAMELVDGVPLDRWCTVERPSVERRLGLFLEVCDAVQAAHAALVVHRDLKPSNVLVDVVGRVRLVDFGIAKALDGGDATATVLGMQPLTPLYASPEQVLGEPVTVATDVYSLGVVLYELLASSSPYGRETSPARVLLAVTSDEPTAPSAFARREDLDAPIRRLGREARADLDAIVMRALRKAPEDRYPTVADLAADVRRFLDGEPVQARRGSTAYRVRKFAGRHRVALAASVVAVATLLGAAGFSFRQARIAAAERDRALAAEASALREARTTEEVVDFLVGLYEEADPARHQGNPPTVEEILETSSIRLLADGPEDPEVRSALQHALARAQLSVGRGDAALELSRAANAAPSPSRRAAVETTLGRSLALTGDLEGAERALRSAREAASDGPSRRSAERALADVLGDLNRLDEAASLLRGAISEAAAEGGIEPARIGSVAGPEGPVWEELANLLADLAEVEMRRGRLEEAIGSGTSAVSIGRELWGADDLRVAHLEVTLGSTLDEADRMAEAVERTERGLAVFRRAYAADHPEVGKVLVNLGGMLRRVGRVDEAVARLEESVGVFTSSVGRRHRFTTVALGNLANAYAALERWEDSLRARREAIEIERELWPDGHPDLVRSLRNLASVLNASGALEAAVEPARDAVEMSRHVAGAEHPLTLDASLALAAVLGDAGRWTEARTILSDLEARTRDAESPLARARVESTLSNALEATGGDRALARDLLRAAIGRIEPLGFATNEIDLEGMKRRLEELEANDGR